MNRKYLLSRWQLTWQDRRKLIHALARIREGRHVRRLQALLLVAQGHPVRGVARMTGLSHQSIYNALTRYRVHHQPHDLADRSRTGRPKVAPVLTDRRILAAVHQDPWALGYNVTNWTANLLARYLQRRYAAPISRFTLIRRLRALRWRWKRPRHAYKHPDPNRAQKKGAFGGG
jgi:transposase